MLEKACGMPVLPVAECTTAALSNTRRGAVLTSGGSGQRMGSSRRRSRRSPSPGCSPTSPKPSVSTTLPLPQTLYSFIVKLQRFPTMKIYPPKKSMLKGSLCQSRMCQIVILSVSSSDLQSRLIYARIHLFRASILVFNLLQYSSLKAVLG